MKEELNGYVEAFNQKRLTDEQAKKERRIQELVQQKKEAPAKALKLWNDEIVVSLRKAAKRGERELRVSSDDECVTYALRDIADDLGLRCGYVTNNSFRMSYSDDTPEVTVINWEFKVSW